MESHPTPSTFKCIKCNHQQFEQGQIRASGGFWSKLFDVQNLKFVTLTCQQCGYTELYKKGSKTAENVLDFFTN